MRTVLLIDRNAGELNQPSPELSEFCIRSYPCVASALEAARVLSPEVILYSSCLGVLELSELFSLSHAEESLAGIRILPWIRRKTLKRGATGQANYLLAETLEEALAQLNSSVPVRSNNSDLPLAEFQGELNAITLIEVVQLLYAAQKTGSLVVISEDTRGELLLNEGLVIHTLFAEEDNVIEEGETALRKLIRSCNSTGRFMFNTCEVKGVPETITKRTDHLLLAVASKLDEDGY